VPNPRLLLIFHNFSVLKFIYIYIYMCVCVCVCIYMCIYICIYIYIRTHTIPLQTMYWYLYFLPNPSACVTHWNLCVFESRNSSKYPLGYFSRAVADRISCWCYVSLTLSAFHASIHDRQMNRRPDHISVIKNLI